MMMLLRLCITTIALALTLSAVLPAFQVAAEREPVTEEDQHDREPPEVDYSEPPEVDYSEPRGPFQVATPTPQGTLQEDHEPRGTLDTDGSRWNDVGEVPTCVTGFVPRAFYLDGKLFWLCVANDIKLVEPRDDGRIDYIAT